MRTQQDHVRGGAGVCEDRDGDDTMATRARGIALMDRGRLEDTRHGAFLQRLPGEIRPLAGNLVIGKVEEIEPGLQHILGTGVIDDGCHRPRREKAEDVLVLDLAIRLRRDRHDIDRTCLGGGRAATCIHTHNARSTSRRMHIRATWSAGSDWHCTRIIGRHPWLRNDVRPCLRNYCMPLATVTRK